VPRRLNAALAFLSKLFSIVLLVVTLAAALLAFGWHRYSPGGPCGFSLTRSQLFAVAAKIEQHKLDVGRYPQALDDLLLINSEGHGPYAEEKDLLDPWGHSFFYRVFPNGLGFAVFTLGSDQKVGGEGKDADIQEVFVDAES
jgi:general secretion pathway protein G